MADQVIGSLRVFLGLDTAEFANGAKAAADESARLGAALRTSLVAAAAAAAAALGGLAVSVKGVLDAADDLSKTSAKIGVPVEELSRLKYAADLSGVSFEQLQTSSGKLARAMADAADGTGAGADAFKKIGVSATNSDGSLKSVSQVMGEVSDKFAALPNGAQKTALAMDLMGKSGAGMIPLLNGGSAALQELMGEADKLGIVITTETAVAAEQFNDNLSRIGYAAQGLSVGIASALAPSLALASDGFVAVVQGAVSLLQSLPSLADEAAVAAGSLGLMLAPALITAATSFAGVIAVQMVGAVRLLGAAIAANPLGALAIGIAAAITAAYHFRDEIQQAIGIDVVQIAKDAGNYVIGSFVAAYEDIKFVWKSFPDIIGAAALGAVNAVIRGVNAMMQAAAAGVDWLIEKVNQIPGMSLSPVGGVAPLSEIANGYAEALSGAVAQRNAAVSGALNTDHIGAIGSAFSGSTPAAQKMGQALDDVGQKADNLSGGAGGGLPKVAKAATEVKGAFDSAFQGLGSELTGLIKGTKTLRDVLLDVVSQLANSALQSGLSGLLGGLGLKTGGAGGAGGGLLSGLFGFAGGGQFDVGGAGGIDSQLVAFRASPNETVSVTKPGQGGMGRDMRISVSLSGANGDAAIARAAHDAALAGAAAALGQVPSMSVRSVASNQARRG